MIRCSTICSVVLAFMGATSLCGCSAPNGGGWSNGDTSRHPLSAAELRIHPLTRLMRREGEGDFSLDLHFELLDRWEHPTKALGEISVSLYGGDQDRDGRGVSIRRWVIDLRDPDENARPYDRVTRTYRFLLTEIPADAVRRGAMRVHAQFVMLDGSRLKDETQIERSAGGEG